MAVSLSKMYAMRMSSESALPLVSTLTVHGAVNALGRPTVSSGPPCSFCIMPGTRFQGEMPDWTTGAMVQSYWSMRNRFMSPPATLAGGVARRRDSCALSAVAMPSSLPPAMTPRRSAQPSTRRPQSAWHASAWVFWPSFITIMASSS